MLPDELFVSLIDTDLQERIAMADNLDGNAAEALKLLLESAPTAKTLIPTWTNSLRLHPVLLRSEFCLTQPDFPFLLCIIHQLGKCDLKPKSEFPDAMGSHPRCCLGLL